MVTQQTLLKHNHILKPIITLLGIYLQGTNKGLGFFFVSLLVNLFLYCHTSPSSTLGHLFKFLCLRSEKIQNQVREDGKKKHLRKKNIGHISGKINVGDKINKNLTYFKKN